MRRPATKAYDAYRRRQARDECPSAMGTAKRLPIVMGEYVDLSYSTGPAEGNNQDQRVRHITDTILYERHQRGCLWRLGVQTFKGRRFGNLRKWYLCGAEWKPSREGFTMPLADLGVLTAALIEFLGLEVPNELSIVS